MKRFGYMLHISRAYIISLLCIILVACGDSNNYAPVTEAGSFEPVPHAGMHIVRHGETLYEIAWRYGMDYRNLAARNNMHSPYILYSGQMIYLRGRNTHTAVAAHRSRQFIIPAENHHSIVDISAAEPDTVVSAWAWPANGKIIAYFSPLNKGINISGKMGEPVYATASGKVVYSGEGLRGYGKLIIVKHNSVYLSAYAHNNTILVNEGDLVKKGQKIAEMGNSGADKIMLHFEIRQAGEPIDPTTFLARPS